MSPHRMPTPGPRGRYFTKGLFDFLRDLKKHNDREWFLAHKDRYEKEVKGPMLRFIADFGPRLRGVSPFFVADPRPVGGSMFRIYRDIRFSSDKSPYKTHAAAHFPHRRRGHDVHAPGFYFHLEPGEIIGGGGIWHPDAITLEKVRNRIVHMPEEWEAIRATGIAVEGDSLKRPPTGYDPEHPFIADLKLKDYYSMIPLSEDEVCGDGLLERFTEVCRAVSPLMKFLTAALGYPW